MNKSLTIEINGTGTHNRGAELMACAISQRLYRTCAGAKLAVRPTFGSYQHRAKYGLYVTDTVPGRFHGLYRRLYLRMAPDWASQVLGIVRDRDVSHVIDASGFSFSDQWGARSAMALLDKVNRRGRLHQKLIMMPQAFGPFRKPEVAAACKQLLSRADLIFARDPDSLEAVRELVPEANASLRPDFTIGVPVLPDPSLELPSDYFAIVPNMRMVDKTTEERAAAYISALTRCSKRLRQAGLQPVVVLHDAREDRKLLPRLLPELGEAQVVEHDDPRVLKWILGQAKVVISSRYHALIGALSQGVPSLGMGWSHKYHWLFEDFGCGDFLLAELDDPARAIQLADRLSESSERADLAAVLRERTGLMRESVAQMWSEVEECLGVAPAPAASESLTASSVG